MIVVALTAGWGAIAAAASVAFVRRVARAERARTLRRRARSRRTARVRSALRVRLDRIGAMSAVRALLGMLRAPARARRRRRRADELLRHVTVAVDLVGVGVAAGCTPYLAVDLASTWSPRLVASNLAGVRRACELGQSFDEALRVLGTRTPELRGLTDCLRTSSRLGSPVGPALARLAHEVRADLRRRAEAWARTVPVRLCFPLVGCILPAFALLTVIPVVLAGLHL